MVAPFRFILTFGRFELTICNINEFREEGIGMKRNYCKIGMVVVMSCFLLLTLGGCYCFEETIVKEDTAIKAPPAPVKAEAPKPAPIKKAADDEALKAEKALRERLMAEAAAFEDIHFDFDKYDLKAPARAKLDGLANWLLKYGEFNANIEGHCDERGTAEYNLALGERRAQAAKSYLVNLGVDGARVNTISYGEEMPLDPRHNEEAWAKNRRDHFVVFPTTWKKYK